MLRPTQVDRKLAGLLKREKCRSKLKTRHGGSSADPKIRIKVKVAANGAGVHSTARLAPDRDVCLLGPTPQEE